MSIFVGSCVGFFNFFCLDGCSLCFFVLFFIVVLKDILYRILIKYLFFCIDVEFFES